MDRIRGAFVSFLVLFPAAAGCDDATGAGGAASASATTSTATASTGASAMDVCPAWADAEEAVGAKLGCAPDPDHVSLCENQRAGAGTCTSEFDTYFACAVTEVSETTCSCGGPNDTVACKVSTCKPLGDAYLQCAAAMSSSASGG